MAIDKKLLAMLTKYSQVFKDARNRDANESDTVLYLTKFFEDALGYDSLSGEISKEHAIKDRYCDIAIKIDGELELLIEAKSAGQKSLSQKHIEQAENYASRAGMPWVLLTNGVYWQLYHVSFAESEGIRSELVFDVEFSEGNLEQFWGAIEVLSKKAISDGELEAFWGQKKALKPSVVVKALFSHDLIVVLRRELNRLSDHRLEIEDVFESLKTVISKEALLDVGDITLQRSRRKKRKQRQAKVVSEVTPELSGADSNNVAESSNLKKSA